MDDIFIVLKSEIDRNGVLNKFNSVHPAINFTMEGEKNGSFPLLDVLLVRRLDGTLKRSVYRKPASEGQYTYFFSAVPLQYKRNLVKCLAYRATAICSDDAIKEECATIRDLFSRNGYPDKFVTKHMNVTRVKTRTPKTQIFLKLRFKSDIASEIITQRMKRVLHKAFPVTKLCPVFYNRATSMWIYQFNCSCGASYFGRTMRQFHRRISEHRPSWLSEGQIRTIKSSILAHLVDTRHQVDSRKAFRIIHRIPINLPHELRTRLLHIAEAIAIHLYKPNLCIQKKFVRPLSLPWPST
ncbi:unnamed protein product [Heterobilharzia americana]|nr:unnamed protein product [Heterobilharzia americana]